MTPASARDLRRARVARLRHNEPDLSHRDIAQRLGISKDTVRRDLEALDADVAQTAPAVDEAHAQDAPPVAHPAPQVTDETAPPAEHSAATVAPSAPARPLPVRHADPLAGMDVSQWRALRRDLAVLAQTGRAPEALVHQAVVAVAHAYKQALASGELEPGRPFLISSMQLRPAAQLADRPIA
ncbi:HTH domain-containing protein [Streptomyces olivaceus]|uniref:HTH domain-containing protein n=1 Tax=Streptomyces olivaceus TaxID=47716 RepID=UPI001CCBD6ED|nr:HTH domain-containing protein [Streptomyces olivaceus]MBZ6259728.1 HTH domain-containing protein [Streptomyces olivaceus]